MQLHYEILFTYLFLVMLLLKGYNVSWIGRRIRKNNKNLGICNVVDDRIKTDILPIIFWIIRCVAHVRFSRRIIAHEDSCAKHLLVRRVRATVIKSTVEVIPFSIRRSS